MLQRLAPLLIVFVLLYGLYLAKYGEKSSSVQRKQNPHYIKHIDKHKKSHYAEALAKVNSSAYVKQYIIDVINHGSNSFDFKGGVMEAGFANPEDAPKIACYVLSLSGKQCDTPYPKDAAMFYTSICGGCHGDDGKGLNGNYPDLTRKKLLGIEAKELFLKSMIK